MQIKREIITTGDGSKTIFFPELNENYHSTHGALQEAVHVFLRNGLDDFKHYDAINILEIGLGTGLNAILTCQEAEQFGLNVNYEGIEAFPISAEEQMALDYSSLFTAENTLRAYAQLCRQEYGTHERYAAYFSLTKTHAKIEDCQLEAQTVDLIYFDAFGPRVQEEMWSVAIFEKLYAALKPSGLLVTYCAKGQVKRDLKSVGFEVESVPGPPGKREMTRAWKR